MKRIAVIADTHNRLWDGLVERLSEASAIWHLGDVCRPETLEPIEALGAPMEIVRGNCDAFPWPESRNLELAGVRIRLIHEPPAPRAFPADVDLLFHAHTHVPRDEKIGGVRILNPGCITRPNRGAPRSFGWLTLEDNKEPQWELVQL